MSRHSSRSFCLLVSSGLLVAAGASLASAQAFAPPPGGWTYIYQGDSADPGSGAADAFDALDGTWGYDNGSSEWDGSAIGAGRPGGASAIDGFLRIQDTGDPRDYGFPDPGSNRKIYFSHNMEPDGAVTNPLDVGLIISFRARVATDDPLDDQHPDGGAGISPWPTTGIGSVIHSSGKGMFGVGQAVGGTNAQIVSFSLVTAEEAAAVGRGSGLVMNNLNGTSPTGDVDTGDAGTLNLLDDTTGAPAGFGVTEWHEYWIEITPGGAGTHQVAIYLDGDSSGPAGTFDVTAGTGNDSGGAADFAYIAMGMGSTGDMGAFDIDFFAVKAIPEPGAAALALFALAGLAAWRRR